MKVYVVARVLDNTDFTTSIYQDLERAKAFYEGLISEILEDKKDAIYSYVLGAFKTVIEYDDETSEVIRIYSDIVRDV